MAVNFPDSPSNDDIHTVGSQTFIYKSSIPGWQRQVSGVNLSSVAQDILPDADSSRDLGSPTKKWKDLHLSGNTIFLGDSGSISTSTGGEIILPSIKVGTGDNAVKLSASATGALQTQSVVAGVSQSVQPAGGTVQVADLAAMQAISNPSIGDMVSVVSNKTIYMYNGTGFYKIAVMVNESPSAITGVDGSYSLATDGTATTITAISSDPEGRALSWSYAVTSGSLTNGGGATATVTQGTGSNTHIFTITPTTNSAYTGSFSITFSVTDNVNGAVNAVSSFTLAFIVQNSRYTALSVKATGTGSNQTFDDASTSNHTITAAGDVTASTFSPHRHGGYSLKFENSVADDNNIKFNNISGSGAATASGEFCVETWVKFTVTAPPAGAASARIFASNGSGGNATDNLQLFIMQAGTSSPGSVSIWNTGYIYQGTSGEVINDDQWHHLAVTRDSSNNLRWFVDGNLITTIASNTTTFQFEETRLGKRDGGTGESCYTGDMRDFRVVIGSSVYESAFTPPTAPLIAITNTHLLVGDLPYIKDESTNNFSIHAGTFTNGTNVLLPKKVPLSLFDNAPYSEAAHGASAYFDGTGDYLNLNGDAEFAFGTNDFTVEFWVYLITGGATTVFCDFRPSGVNGTYTTLFLETDNTIKYFHQNGTRITSTSTIPLNAWSHIALTRSGYDVKLFINGQQEGSTFTNSLTQLVGANGPVFGSSAAGQFFLNGYMSDIRILNGTAAYTSNFTPPTEPLTAVTNTKFLFNPETSISDLSQRNALITVGGVATSTTQVKFSGTKSIYIGAQGDYINSIRDSTIPIFPNGDSQDWTLEYWYYPTSIAGFNYIFNIGDSFQMTSVNGGLGIWTKNGGSTLFQQNQIHIVTENTWSHIAIVRNGNNYNVYVDGVSRFNTTNSNEVQTGTNNLHIGDKTPYNNGALNFYIQDFRITKGLARYTSTFTPPTAELEG